ncbi:MAG: sensor histidine kinase [Bacteroidota bacterium]
MGIFKPTLPSRKEISQAVVFAIGFSVLFYFVIPNDDRYFSFLVNFFLFFFISLGNGIITDGIRISWIEAPVKRLLYNILFATIYTPIAALLAVVIALFIRFGRIPKAYLEFADLGFFLSVLAITYFIGIFLSGRSFLMNWRASEIKAAQLQAAQTAAQYESLQNQVNPHFLFNSLNVLSSLVYKDQDLAAKFIKQLSKVYRYVLEVKNKEVVTLETELDALEAYIFLLKIRFAKGLIIENQLSKKESIQLVPLSLQMLFENAIKHNSVHADQPLTIKLSATENHIIVENNLQRKSNPQESTGIGLENIKKRYQYLSDQTVIVQENATHFTVKLPILNIDDSTDS